MSSSGPSRDRGRGQKRDRSRSDSAGPSRRPDKSFKKTPEKRKKREEFFNQIVTRPTSDFDKRGKVSIGVDKIIELVANFFVVNKTKNFNVTCYRLDFEPEVELRKVRSGLIFQLKPKLGVFLYDGESQIYLLQSLPEDPMTLRSTSREKQVYKLKFRKTREIVYTDATFLQVLNLVMRNTMRGLKLQLVGRNYYDPAAKIELPQHHLQIWPGYITSIRQHENNLLLNCHTAHKVMRQENVLGIIEDCVIKGGNYRETAQRKIIGSTVLTDYNNATYQVADIDWNQNPASTFEMKKGPESYANYYKRRYNLVIKDMKQPMLVIKAKARDIRAGQSELILLVPELCRATGITDEHRSNSQLMRAMNEKTRMSPRDRIIALNKFNQRLQRSEASVQDFRDSFLELDRNLVQFEGRVLPAEPVEFGHQRTSVAVNADWTNPQKSNTMFKSVMKAKLRNWFFMYPKRSEEAARVLMTNFNKAANGLIGVRGQEPEIAAPKHVQLADDQIGTYTRELNKILSGNPSFVMILVPNNRTDRYKALKKITLIRSDPVPIQVVVERSLKKNVLSVATKIVVQVDCKLGGVPWMVDLKLSGMLIIGFDVSHDPRNKSRSYGAMVASLNPKNNGGHFFSTVRRHESGSNISETFGNDVLLAMRAYVRCNVNAEEKLPKRILIYRDGVGDGDIERVKKQEVDDIIPKLKNFYAKHDIFDVPKLGFIIMNKRTNTRIMSRGGRNGFDNPSPGTVVDDVITLPERFDFYLVSQHSIQGTVSPTYYNVIYNEFYKRPEVLQTITNKLCHLYYNWSGTTRIPSVLQYAKKLAFLVGQYLEDIPSENIALDNQLYFL